MERPLCARFIHILGALAPLLAYTPAKAQLVLDQDIPPDSLVQNVLMGPKVTISDVTFNGYPGDSYPPYDDNIRIARFNGENSSVGLPEGVVLVTGNYELLHGPNNNWGLTVPSGGYPFNPTPDLDLSRLTGWINAEATNGANIYHKSILEFDLVPLDDMLSFRYVFSSEEYEIWACSRHNDAFGLFLSGPGINGPYTNNAINLAHVPGTLTPISINAINSGMMANNANGPLMDPFQWCFAADSSWLDHTQYYVYNGSGSPLQTPYGTDPHYFAHNGRTVVLTASAAVQIGETYHIKMGVGNAADHLFPSAVFIEQGSFACSDRFTLTVDEGPNVGQVGNDVTLFESDIDSIHLRFNRWGGFYLDEKLQIAVEGDAVAGEDYMPVLSADIHFKQLDSAVVVPLAIPVRSNEMRELNVHLITSNGDKVMTYHLMIAPEITLGNDMTVGPRHDRMSVFPNPAEGIVHVVLPAGMEDRTELHVLDMAGRVVMQRTINGARSTSLDLSQLPNGLYTVKANTRERMMTARVSVRH